MTAAQKQLHEQLQQKHAQLQRQLLQQQEELRKISEQLLFSQFGSWGSPVIKVRFENLSLVCIVMLALNHVSIE